MSERRLLAVLGSPRETGITAAMLECVIKAASASGWKVDRWIFIKRTSVSAEGAGSAWKGEAAFRRMIFRRLQDC